MNAMTAFYLLIGIASVALLACLFFSVRLDYAYHAMVHILDRVTELAEQDAENGGSGQWRFDEFEKVNVETVAWKFWVRPEDHWKDKAFLEPSPTTKSRYLRHPKALVRNN